jgi:membrane protein DedA with SNARE-associated domain
MRALAIGVVAWVVVALVLGWALGRFIREGDDD